MLKKLLTMILIFSFFIVLENNCFSQENITLPKITARARGKIQVAIAPLDIKGTVSNATDLKTKYQDTLIYDLEYSDICTLIKNSTLIQETFDNDKKSGKTDYGAWKSFGTEVLISGTLSQANQRLILDLFLDDINDQTRIVGKRYKGTPNEIRNWLHHFADEVVYNYTTQKGIAQTKIAFVAGDHEVKELYLMDYDGQNIKKVTQNKSLILFPSWAPDGERLVFTSYQQMYPDLYMVDFKTGTYTSIARFPGINTQASWHPKKDLLVMVLSKDGNPDIYTYDLNTKKTRRLVKEKSVESSPSWSPDGEKILYTTDGFGGTRIQLMDSLGTKNQSLTYKGFCDEGDWNPVDQSIVFIQRSGKNAYNIFTTPGVGGTPKQITFGEGSNENPSWAPDGRHIVFTSTRTGSAQIYIMDSDGTDVRRLTYGIPGDSKNPAWSPN